MQQHCIDIVDGSIFLLFIFQ